MPLLVNFNPTKVTGHPLLRQVFLLLLANYNVSPFLLDNNSRAVSSLGWHKKYFYCSLRIAVCPMSRNKRTKAFLPQTRKNKLQRQEVIRLSCSSTIIDSKTSKKFLLKSEPADFSIDHLKDEVDQTVVWDGIRNHEAKNNLLSMDIGDECFFYHSSCKTPGIVGLVTVVSKAEADATAIDPNHTNYDPKCAQKTNNCWVAVKVKLNYILPSIIALQQLKEEAASNPSGPIAQMTLLRRPRLSVSTLTEEQWNAVLNLIPCDEQTSNR